jgi:hypothetical protein
MYTCMHPCIRVRIHVYTCIHPCVYVYALIAYVYASMHTCMHGTRVCIHVYTCMHPCIRSLYLCVSVYVVCADVYMLLFCMLHICMCEHVNRHEDKYICMPECIYVCRGHEYARVCMHVCMDHPCSTNTSTSAYTHVSI